MKLTSKNLIVFLLSLALISMEIIWSRIFSAEYFYTFAFLILSVSILGLGLGALSLRMSKWLSNMNNYGGLLSITAGLMLIGPPLILHLQLDFTQLLNSNWMVFKLIATILILGSSFFTGGIILSSIFSKSHKDMPRLYMADLIGAAMGVVASVLLMNTLGTDKAALMISLPVLLSAVFYIHRWFKLIPVILIIASFTALPYSSELLTRPKKERAEVIYTHWDAMARLKVYKYNEENWGLNIDDAANSPVYKFDGDFNRPDSLKIQFWIHAHKLTSQFDSCRFLSMGAGAGGDVLQALQDNASEVHAVEVNPFINKMMTEGFLKDFSGNIYNDPRVKVVSEDARAYVRRFNNHFDVIYSSSSNSFAALASGSFALAENYLFTTEAFQDYYKAMSAKGYMLLEHQFYVPRMVSEVLEALKLEGVKDPASHIAVYSLPTMRRQLILIGKQVLSKDLIQDAVYKANKENYPYYRLMYPAVDSVKNNMINQIVINGWQKQQEKSLTELSPCYDNKPFIAQLGMMKNLSFEKIKKRLMPYEFQGFPLAKVIVLVILFIVLILILPLNLLPYLKKGIKLKAAGWLYFFTIGIAFMAVEVVLIQKYTLFIGSSSYTFMTILFVLLASSGLGSLMSPKFKKHTPFLFISLWLIAEILLFPYICTSLAELAIFWRIIITCILIAPLGFFMGMPFVKGSSKTGELIDWGFAVNGAASVIGSTLVLLPVFKYGFSSGLILAIVFYLLAYLLLRKTFKTKD